MELGEIDFFSENTLGRAMYSAYAECHSIRSATNATPLSGMLRRATCYRSISRFRTLLLHLGHTCLLRIVLGQR